MKVTGDLMPSSNFTVQKMAKKPGYVLVRFFENAKEYSYIYEGTTYTGWEYDEYKLELKDNGSISEDITGNYNVFLNQAKLNEKKDKNIDDDMLDLINQKIIDVEKETRSLSEELQTKLSMQNQIQVASMFFVKTATTIPDSIALQMTDLFITWEDALSAGEKLEKGTIINDGGQIYRVIQEGGVTPLESQAPHDEGMLAVYRPIDTTHSGSMEDPIPFIEGMDTENGKHYTYNGKLYLCKQDMKPCVWTPDTPGLWQWELVE